MTTDLGWCVLHATDLIGMLTRAHEGEDPDLLFAEWYANSDHEHVEGN